MKRSVWLWLLMAASLAHAEPFDVRVQLGEAAEAHPAFKSYLPTMVAQVGDHLAVTMRACIERTQHPDFQAFVLVADIGPSGKAGAVEVRPNSNLARCFAAGVVDVGFPQPPAYPNRSGFPVTIRMRLTP